MTDSPPRSTSESSSLVRKGGKLWLVEKGFVNNCPIIIICHPCVIMCCHHHLSSSSSLFSSWSWSWYMYMYVYWYTVPIYRHIYTQEFQKRDNSTCWKRSLTHWFRSITLEGCYPFPRLLDCLRMMNYLERHLHGTCKITGWKMCVCVCVCSVVCRFHMSRYKGVVFRSIGPAKKGAFKMMGFLTSPCCFWVICLFPGGTHKWTSHFESYPPRMPPWQIKVQVRGFLLKRNVIG